MDEFYFKPWLSLQNKHKSTSAAANPFRLACRGIRMGDPLPHPNADDDWNDGLMVVINTPELNNNIWC